MVVHAHCPAGKTRVERQAMALLDHGAEVYIICFQANDGEDLARKILTLYFDR